MDNDALRRRLAELEALAERQSLLEAVIEGSSDAIYVKDLQGCYRLFNRAAAAFAGKPAAEVLGKDDRSLFPAAEARAFVELDRRARTETVTDEEAVTLPDGRRIVVLSTKGPVRDAAGNVIGTFGVTRDVTARRQAEAALRVSEEKYRGLVEATATGFVILDGEGRVLDANQEYVRVTGRQQPADLLTHRMLEWIAPHDQARAQAELRRCFAQGFVRNLELDFITPGGQRIPVEINATVVHVEDRRHILSVCRDISERRQTQEEIEKLAAVVRYSNEPALMPISRSLSAWRRSRSCSRAPSATFAAPGSQDDLSRQRNQKKASAPRILPTSCYSPGDIAALGRFLCIADAWAGSPR